MHYHLEIVMPPTDDIGSDVARILEQFDENAEDNHDGFFDWYVIGGRFAGSKTVAGLDKQRLDEFYEWLTSEKVTVSTVQAGKQSLHPESQIPKVDAKWAELFPDSGDSCPLFSHSNDQYGRGGDGAISGDVCELAKIPSDMKCSRVIIAGPSHSENGWAGPVKAVHMQAGSVWNGVNHMDTAWDGTVPSVIAEFRDRLKSYRPEYAAAVEPRDNWLCVTVDCHS